MNVLLPKDVFAPGREPRKAEIIQLLERMLQNTGASVSRITRAQLFAVTPAADTYPRGEVLNDPNPSYNGWWDWDGSTWVFGRKFPDTLARLTVTGGTENDISAIATTGVDPGAVVAFFIDIETPNTGNVVVAINGAAPVPALNINGDQFAPGEWHGRLFLSNEGDSLRAMTDAATAASAAASAASAAQNAALAQQWAEVAEEIAVPDSFTAGLTAAVSSISAIKALSTTRHKSVELYGSERAGHFDWFAGDQSALLINKTVTSTAVNSSTETITAAAHELYAGDAVLVTTAVNGLALNTPYFVIRVDADNFRLASTYNASLAGTAFNLTGTTNFTVKRLADLLNGVYIVPTGLALDGSQGAWCRRHNKTMDIRWFGAIADGVFDNRQAILTAFEVAASVGGNVHAPAGTWAFNGDIYVYRRTPLLTDGAEATIFKNTTMTGAGLYFEKHASGGGPLRTSFIAISGGFTLDQNGSTGNGLTLRAQHTTVDGQVFIKNQGEGGYACLVDGATLLKVDFLALSLCKRGLHLQNAYYPRIERFVGEVSTGPVISALHCVSMHLGDLYLDPGSNSDGRPSLARFEDCHSTIIDNLTVEYDNGGLLSGPGLIVLQSCQRFFVHSGRVLLNVAAYAALDNKSVFLLSGQNDGITLEEMTILMAGGLGALYVVRSLSTGDNQTTNLKLSRIASNLANAGSRYLYYVDTYAIDGLSISGCTEIGGAMRMQVRGRRMRIEDFNGPVVNEGNSDSGGQTTTFINSFGVKTNFANATRVNSA